LKILYIANGNGTSPTLGGSMNRTIEISKRLKQYGNDIIFVTSSNTSKLLRDRGLDPEFRLVRTSFSNRIGTSAFDRLNEYVVSTVSSVWHSGKNAAKYDIIYNDSDYFCDVIPAIVYKFRSKAKWVAMTHHMIRPRDRVSQGNLLSRFSSLLQRFSYWLFVKFADAVFVYDSPAGRDIRDYLVSHGYPVDRIDYVTNGVSRGEIEMIPHGDAPRYDACFVGGFRPLKGIYDIVPVWKKVVKSAPNAALLVVGGGIERYERELRLHIESQGLVKNLTLAGALPWPDTIRALKQSKVFITTSYEEGWGIAVCEAMACGLPVVAYDLPAFSIFNNQLAKVNVGDTKAFAEEILKFIRDPALRQHVGRSNKEFSDRFDWDEIAEKEMNLFQRILAKRG
jgi:glycosyltransferase involved in cell wall biosynthesis